MIRLPSLPYTYQALEPYLDSKTVEIHYSKHHAKYVENANKILEKIELEPELSLGRILLDIQNIPQEYYQGLFNNLGQVFNHNLYWQSISPHAENLPLEQQAPLLTKKLIETFGDLDTFTQKFKQAGLEQFGSGWVWLVTNDQGTLTIEKTSNADSPIFRQGKPILVLDVWEHAYYLKYQNQRDVYIDNFLAILDWQKAEKRYQQALEVSLLEFIDSI